MSLRNKPLPRKRENVTIVFGLAPGSQSRSLASVELKRPESPVAKQLIESGRAEPVLGDRAVMSNDPILGGLYVLNGVDKNSADSVVEELKSDGIERAFIAPTRELLEHPEPADAPAPPPAKSWQAQVKLAEARQLAQWTPKQKVTVSAIDSGVDNTHPQLKHVVFIDHLTKHPTRSDVLGHGTHVIGLIAARPYPGNSLVGVAADCTDVTMHRGMDSYHDVSAYYRALRAAGTARILNLSEGGKKEDPVETDLIQDAFDQGCVVVAAMGNTGQWTDQPIYPAAIPGVIAVAAVDGQGAHAPFSNTGNNVLLAAPGVEIMSTVPTYGGLIARSDGYPPLGPLTGTSMATPIVSGTIARMLAYQPSLTRAQVIDFIRTRLNRSWNIYLGHGIVDVHALLSAL